MLVSTGLIISRFFAGRLIDKGSLKAVIIYGKLLLLIAYIAIAVTYHEYIFFVASFFVGLGYGLVTPAYQTLFNNLALPSKRATANSMFFTAFDVGIASSAAITGIVGQFSTLNTVLFIGIGFMAISLLFFLKCTAPHYDADRVS